MRVERDIAGFALPFTVGIMTATIRILPVSYLNPFPSALMTAAVFIPVSFLIHPKHKRLSGNLISILATLSAFFCGLTTGLTHNAMSICDGVSGSTSSTVTHMLAGMKATIDALPFRNQDTNALLTALLTGDRSGIPPNITEYFRGSGASHILALSGLHLGIIYSIINKTLSIIGNSRTAMKTRSLGVVAICSIYTVATGAGASIVRALIYIVTGEICRFTGRHRSGKHILCTALVIQLSLFPSDIRSVSFQLSYAAMAGITYIYPWIRNLWPDSLSKGVLGFIWNSAAISISCQLTTAPLAWIYFRSMPIYFILTNLIAVPLTGIIISSAVICIVLAGIGTCPETMTRATEGLVQTLTAALEVISSM